LWNCEQWVACTVRVFCFGCPSECEDSPTKIGFPIYLSPFHRSSTCDFYYFSNLACSI
jgi:hypothetical protein